MLYYLNAADDDYCSNGRKCKIEFMWHMRRGAPHCTDAVTPTGLLSQGVVVFYPPDWNNTLWCDNKDIGKRECIYLKQNENLVEPPWKAI